MNNKKVCMEHGGGGHLMQKLIESTILKNLSLNKAGSVGLDSLDDGASINISCIEKSDELIMTTDSHVIDPIFFPGGDIGKISICGTINDLSMMGAKPLALSCSLIIPEGFNIDDLDKIMSSINEISKEVNVPIITGDTKTIEGNNLKSIVINMSGIGLSKRIIRNSGLKMKDKIIITGDIGDHGISILTKREGFEFKSKLKSDVAPLWNIVESILRYEKEMNIEVISSMKDPTRGGVASSLNEMSDRSNVGIKIYEEMLPIKKEVRSACEMLGLDPLEIANEGKAIIGVNSKFANEVLNIIKNTKYGKNAKIIGEVVSIDSKFVILESKYGSQRFIDIPTGDPIPRVC